MASSPRKRVRSTFDQTWQETDAAFLDPSSLPIPKLPRAWERKPETTTTRDGKQRKIYRRIGTRSQSDNTNNSSMEEVEDVGSGRAVKKLRVRSNDTSDEVPSVKAKARSSRATRYDRRQSALPRKMVSHNDVDTLDARHEVVGHEHDAPEEPSENFECEDEKSETTAPEPPITEQDNGGDFSFQLGLPQHDLIAQQENPEAIGCDQETAPESFSTQDELSMPLVSLSSRKLSNGLLNSRPDEEIQDTEVPQVEEAEERVTAPVSAREGAVIAHEGAVHDPDQSKTGSHEDVEYKHDVSQERTESGNVHMNNSEDAVPEPTTIDGTAVLEVSEPHLVEVELPVKSDEALTVSETATPGIYDVPQTNFPRFNEPVHVDSTLPTPSTNETIDDGKAKTTETTMNNEPPSVLQVEEDAEMSSSPEELATSIAENGSADDDHASNQDVEDTEMPDAHEESVTPVSHKASIGLVKLSDEGVQDAEMAAPVEEILPQAEDIPADEGIPSSVHNVEKAEATSASEAPSDALFEEAVNDITNGLTLGSSNSSSIEAEPQKQQTSSSSLAEPGSDEIGIQLDDDTALLKDFLNRAAASKASKAVVISRRESLQNRRDSGAVRQALASPRKVLEDKDPNSPSKAYDNTATLDLDLSQTLTLNFDEQPPLSPTPEQPAADASEVAPPSGGSRRSTRTRKSRLPAPQGPKNIAVRRADGNEPVVLRKTEAQELAILTRNNTHKNKQGAVSVTKKLIKLTKEEHVVSAENAAEVGAKDTKGKSVKWDEQLTYFQEAGTESAEAGSSEASADGSESAVDELSLPILPSAAGSKPKGKAVADKEKSVPRVRRLRGLGAVNGTPGKGLLGPASLLPVEVQEEKEASKAKGIPKPSKPSKASKAKKLPLVSSTATTDFVPAPTTEPTAALELEPVGVPSAAQPKEALKTTTKERKSRLVTPRKVKLPQPITTTNAATTVPVEGKENLSQQSKGIVVPVPKKGLPVAQMVVPAVVAVPAETGLSLPRRRGTRRV
ncbi:hypothetical protein GQ43DRAFT_464008 [Delitschia confertaspora ATCC 74209]|uniref:Uncharacterized protein n=1 Tax=Delitschia confertaspora ATCC 74209 TaxID=1513339 RepID=A0A9P4JJR2_9PLEO|nr:hypothetical protein GQ43DRAFT_464008 [Delitschia confertaspora ATCC 74209]